VVTVTAALKVTVNVTVFPALRTLPLTGSEVIDETVGPEPVAEVLTIVKVVEASGGRSVPLESSSCTSNPNVSDPDVNPTGLIANDTEIAEFVGDPAGNVIG
jgi:hypothetical protein